MKELTLYDDPKPWYMSRTIIGGVISGAAGILGFTISNVDASQLTDILVSSASAIGGALSVYGRIKATREIAPIVGDHP